MKTLLLTICSLGIALQIATLEKALALGMKLPDTKPPVNGDTGIQPLPDLNPPSSTPNPSPEPPQAPPPSTPIPIPLPPPTIEPPKNEDKTAPLWESKKVDGTKWTEHANYALDSLGKNMLGVVPADSSTFCPNYKNLTYEQRKEFWVYLISAMSRYESNFNPDARYQENFKDSQGEFIISRGLLQLSIESSQGYQCGFSKAQELHDPYKNLSCGIRILDRWMERDGRIAGKVGNAWKGGARYWSVLRTGGNPYASIVQMTKSIPICK